MNAPDFPSDLIMREFYTDRIKPFIRKQLSKCSQAREIERVLFYIK
jgi:hypothetical protein